MDELIATLEREAEERCTAIVAEARDQAARERGAAEARMERRREEARSALEAELRARDAAAGASARKEIHRVLLRARRRALDRVFRRARELLPDVVDSAAWRATVPRLLREALSCLEDPDVEAVCPPGLGEVVRDAVPDDGTRLHVSEREDASPGFVLRGTPSEVQVDVTLATRLAALRPELEMAVLRDLEAAE